jgi:hypothetical protein
MRQAFADQFEQDGSGFIYRRSQKGAAIRVSADERSRFIDEYNRNLGRATWIMYPSIAVVLVGLVVVPVLGGFNVPQQPLIVGGIVVALVPFVAYYKWAWGAPAREIAGRTPVAGERSPDEVHRLQFQRVTYGQLAIAAFAGLILPFIESSHGNVLSGWNRIWLVVGGALVLLAAVQACRKWRFEQEDSYRKVIPQPPSREITAPAFDAFSPPKGQLWRYLPLAAILLGLAFIAYTSAGKHLAQTPGFWPAVTTGIGGWALFTVARGFAKGQIEPFARGFYRTYQRETEPKRFWASMTWNAICGCLCLWLAFQLGG